MYTSGGAISGDGRNKFSSPVADQRVGVKFLLENPSSKAMPKTKTSLDEAEVAELLALKDEVKANGVVTTGLRADLTQLKQDVQGITSAQDKFNGMMSGVQSTMSDLGKQMAELAASMKSLQPFQPSTSTAHQPEDRKSVV